VHTEVLPGGKLNAVIAPAAPTLPFSRGTVRNPSPTKAKKQASLSLQTGGGFRRGFFSVKKSEGLRFSGAKSRFLLNVSSGTGPRLLRPKVDFYWPADTATLPWPFPEGWNLYRGTVRDILKTTEESFICPEEKPLGACGTWPPPGVETNGLNWANSCSFGD